MCRSGGTSYITSILKGTAKPTEDASQPLLLSLDILVSSVLDLLHHLHIVLSTVKEWETGEGDRGEGGRGQGEGEGRGRGEGGEMEGQGRGRETEGTGRGRERTGERGGKGQGGERGQRRETTAVLIPA